MDIFNLLLRAVTTNTSILINLDYKKPVHKALGDKGLTEPQKASYIIMVQYNRKELLIIVINTTHQRLYSCSARQDLVGKVQSFTKTKLFGCLSPQYHVFNYQLSNIKAAIRAFIYLDLVYWVMTNRLQN